MLMQSKVIPNFCIGSLLNCLDMLPDYKSVNFKQTLQTYYKVSNRKYSEMLHYKTAFNTIKTHDEEITMFANAALTSMLEHRFFCNNDQYIAECFFGDLKDALDLDHTNFIDQAEKSKIAITNNGKRQYILNLMECPICAKMILPDQFDAKSLSPGMELLADNEFTELTFSNEWLIRWNVQFKNKDESLVRFWKKCYFCMFGLLREALFMHHNQSGLIDEQIDSWIKEIELVNRIYRKYLEQTTLSSIAVTKLYQLYLEKQGVDDEDDFVDSLYSEEARAKPVCATTSILPDTFHGIKMDYSMLTTNLRINDRVTPYKCIDYKDPLGHFIPLMYNEIILPKKNICYNSTIFDIENTQTRVDINAPHMGRKINFISSNYRDLLLHVAIVSAKKSDYRPFSYRKVHIDTCKKSNIIPGEESRFKFYLKLSPIEFFDHMVVRNYLNNVYSANGFTLQYDRDFFVRNVEMTVAGFEDTGAFYLMAGCGIWVVSSDNYLMISRRSNVLEKPINLGYSAAGSCEYSTRLKSDSNVSEFEANPFLTAKRELFEECALDIPVEKLQLIAFGIDYERYLQQFSFYYRAERTADQLLELSKHAESCNEQVLFAIPFTDENISQLTRTFEIEPGAVVSLFRLWELLH